MKRMTGWVRGGDITTFFWVNRSWRCTFYDRAMPWLTQLGGATWCIVLSLALLLGPSDFCRDLGVQLAASLLLSHLVVAACKKLVPRSRPYLVLDDVATGGHLLRDASFPSGHATASFCMATVLSHGLPECAPLFYLLSTGVACSRVYLGLHDPSDIAIGAVIGTLTAWLIG
jgi:undecaprenyl-diphosphatase